MRRVTGVLMVLLGVMACPNGAAPQNLEYVTSALWAQAYGVTMVGPYAYCAWVNGLVILDVSNPLDPQLISRTYCQGNGLDVDVAGDYAFLANDTSGLQVINVSDPHNPVVEACYDTPGRASDVTVSDGYAYIADGPGSDSGLLILDVSTPTAPHYVSNFVTQGMCESIFIDGDQAYVGGIYCGLEIVDISDPYHPTLLKFYEMCSSAEIFVSGNTAYATGGCGGAEKRPDEYSILHIFDVADPANPIPLGEYIFEGFASGPVAVSGDHAYVRERDAEWREHIRAIDVSDPSMPVLAGSVETNGRLLDLRITGDTIHAAMGSGGFQILDISAPSSPVVTAVWWEASGPASLSVKESIAYVADAAAGLRVVDISNPQAPVSIGSLSMPGSQGHIRIAGDYAYLVDFADCLNIVEITDPHDPELISRIEERVFAASIADGYAYLAEAGDGLRVFDISDPQEPFLAGHCSVPGYCWDVCAAGKYAYVCAFQEGLQVIDISDPTDPGLRGNVSIEREYFQTLALVYPYAYVPTNNANLQIFDVSDPDDPMHAGTFPLPCHSRFVSVHGDQLFVGTYSEQYASEVTVLDITDRLQPVVQSSYEIPGYCSDVHTDGEHVWVTAWGSLLVLGYEMAGVESPVSGVHETVLGLRVRNPALDVADIQFRAPRSSAPRVDVIDVAGRQWATLYDGPGTEEAYHLSWNWHAAGIASGTYFIRVSANGRVVTRPITLIR